METSIRLIYEKFSTSDSSNYVLLQTNGQVMKYISGQGLTENEALEKFERILALNGKDENLGYFTVTNNSTGEFIGLAKIVMFSDSEIEIGYSLLPEHWGKGYASEIVAWQLKFSSKIPLKGVVIAIVAPGNNSSKSVLLKNGFTFWKNGHYNKDEVEFYRLQTET